MFLEFVALIVSVLVLHANPCWAQSTSKVIPNCYSETSLYYSSARTIRERSDLRYDMLILPNTGPKIEIFCLSFDEQTIGLVPTDCGKSIPWLCKRNANAPENAAWDCEKIAAFVTDVNNDLIRGSIIDKTYYKWKIQWDPNAKNAECYPRKVTLNVVVRVITQESSNLVVSIIFIIIFAGIGILVFFFGAYQFKKVMGKFWKAEQKAGRRVMETLEADQGRDNAEMSFQQPDILGFNEEEQEDVPRTQNDNPDNIVTKNQHFQDHAYGMPPKTITDAAVASREVPPAFHQNQSAITPWKTGEVRTVVPLPYLETIQRSQSRGPPGGQTVSMGGTASSPLAEDAVYACVDCLLDIHDPKTPQLCNVSGKRHY